MKEYSEKNFSPVQNFYLKKCYSLCIKSVYLFDNVHNSLYSIVFELAACKALVWTSQKKSRCWGKLIKINVYSDDSSSWKMINDISVMALVLDACDKSYHQIPADM